MTMEEIVFVVGIELIKNQLKKDGVNHFIASPTKIEVEGGEVFYDLDEGNIKFRGDNLTVKLVVEHFNNI